MAIPQEMVRTTDLWDSCREKKYNLDFPQSEYGLHVSILWTSQHRRGSLGTICLFLAFVYV
jgi:hypothetical protein